MIVPLADVRGLLAEKHYLGPARTGWAWLDEHGAMVFSNPRSRRLPQHRWVELTRWCLLGEKNAGSKQFSRIKDVIRAQFPGVTTIVSYSDPSVGHTGALYKACNWLWAPTWHRLRPPPSGNGCWVEGKKEAVKDRWVYPLRRDPGRVQLLAIQDESLVRRGFVGYVEPRKGYRD